MPFAQVHYPFENKEWFEGHFPGDFIVEYVGQTRGWFYTLMVLATALFDKAPFRNCICHGVVLDENKQKLSKRLKNYPDPVAVFNDYGADALRWYMVSSPLLSGGDLAMPKDGRTIAETVRQVLLPIWNAYSFFTLYANIDGIKGKLVTTDQADQRELDRYILVKTGQLVRSVESAMDRLDLAAACNTLPPFIEALNNWYIRRSRDVFWKAEKDDAKTAAYDTLYTVLVTLCRAMAPFLPYLTEQIHRALVGESVHLQDWPDATPLEAQHFGLLRDGETRDYGGTLVKLTDLVRMACSAAASIRTGKNLRNRLPLRKLTIAHPEHDQLRTFEAVITEEANVKQVTFAPDPSRFGAEVLVVNPRIVGKRLGFAMKDILAASKAGQWKKLDGGAIEVAGQRIEPDEYELRFKAAEGLDATSFDGSAGVVVLDTKVDAELEREGLARDFIRLVQVARKDAGFNVADRIAIEVKAGPAAAAAIEAHLDTVKSETLALSLGKTTGVPAGFVSEQKLQDEPIAIGVRVAG
jgi:isoleucyl-tRNA synthetase